MSNKLKRMEKDLRTLAKRCKNVKYTKGLLLSFLLMGMLTFSEGLTSPEVKSTEATINQTRKELNASINDMYSSFRQARRENNRLLKNANLELIQLMEQGDQVVKSPWSSWQFGMNYFYSNWRGAYKGRGDKKEKYPYEGILERDKSEFNRYVSPISSFYNLLAVSKDPTSASSNARNGLIAGYGLASNKSVLEPVAELELSAGINPKKVDKKDLNLVPKSANVPILPEPVRFSPISPEIAVPVDPALPDPPTFAIVLGADCNEGCNSSSTTPRQNTKSGFLSSAANESMQNIDTILHYTWSNNRGAEKGYAFKMYKEGNTASLPPVAGNKYYFNSYNFGNGNTTEFSNGVVNATSGDDKNHQRFFIGGSRFWEIDNISSGTFTIPSAATVNLGGIYTLALVSQQNGTTLRNEGIITDIEEKNEKYIQDTPQNFSISGPTDTVPKIFTKNSDGYVGYKVGIAQVEENELNYSSQNQKLQNAKTIDFRGNNSMGMYVYLPTSTTYAKVVNESTGEIMISGAESYGMKIAAKSDNSAEMINEGLIRLQKNPDGNAKADNSVGMALMNDPTVNGGVTFGSGKAKNKHLINVIDVQNSLGTYVNIATDIENTSTGVINVNSFITKAASGAQPVNIGMRSDTNSNAKSINNGNILLDGSYAMGMLANGAKLTNAGTITTGNTISNGVGIVGINNAVIENSGKIKLTGENNNIGIFLKNGSTGTIGTVGSVPQSVEVSGDKSTGVLVSKGTGAASSLVMAGDVKASGNNVAGIVADESTVILNGSAAVTVDNGGNVSGQIDDKGSYGIVVKGSGGSFTGTNTDITAKVTTDKSAGLYSEGSLTVNKANITATDGAINLFANNGRIITNGGTTETGQKSLLFYTSGNNSNIQVNGSMNATIKGGTDPSTRGTAFYYEHSGVGYGNFDTAAIQNYFNSTFGNAGNSTLGNLTLNMQSGSRLFVASKVLMNLSDTVATNLMSGIAGAPTINGSDYKTFMLYLSKLVVNQAVDLNNTADAYNQLEIANSSIENTNTITGTQNKQVAMAQENGNDTSGNGHEASKVTLINAANGTITLTGDESTGMYAKRGQIHNDGIITVGKKSTAIYLIDDNEGPAAAPTAGTVTNAGTITLGEDSTGVYYKAESTGTNPNVIGGVSNDGKIVSSSNNVIGMTFDSPNGSKKFSNESTGEIELNGDKSTAMYATGAGTYTAKNEGLIKLSSSADSNNPNVGMFTDKSQISLESNGKITAGDRTVGLYGYASKLGGTSETTVGAGATGIYSKGGNVTLDVGSKLSVGANDAVGVYYVGSGGTINNNASSINIGDGSYGFVIKNAAVIGGNTLNSNTANVSLGNDAVYIYSNDNTGQIFNNTVLSSTGNGNYGVYSAGTVTNNADINFGTGIGNVGIYSINGGTATNAAGKTITIGDSDPGNSKFGIGMAAGYEASDTGNIVNDGIINVNGKSSIGMYATGNGSKATNSGFINLAGDGAIGMYLDNGAEGFNIGTITTVGSPKGAVGIAVRKGATFTNTGNIHIDSSGGYAFFVAPGGIIKNYGNFTLAGGAKKEFTPGSKPTGKEVAGVEIHAPAKSPTATITKDGIQQPIVKISNAIGQRNPLSSSFGMYIDTLKGTNPIGGLSAIKTTEADLIIGAEAGEATNSKYILLSGDSQIISPYNQAIKNNPQISNWKIYSGALTWIATATIDSGAGVIKNVYLAKVPYTAYAGNTPTPVEVTDTYNFLDGLEQRYGVEGLGTREKALFNKLNNIGKNEEALFFQATDEMMGHQYANTQQRIYGTGRLLDKEFTHLKKEWDNKSKQSNKIKAFGMRDEYKTDTAGVIDYISNAYGVAYVHEDETIKLGNSTGWYAGAVHNRFKFKDIGKSKEDTTMLKVGVFKSKAFDHNGSLNWTISGEGYVSRSDMHRKFLVVDEIFNAKSSYYTYGAALKNEISKEFRTSERTSIKPYGSLKLEYGRFGSIKEKTGEVRLEIEGNDYYSVRPEVGMEFKYKQPVAKKTTFVTTLGLGYENELGKVGDVGNKGRVRYTTADWFNIRGEKDDRKGNFKADLNVGVENQRVGVTFNVGYDTKGENIRGGIGFRAIY